MVSPPLHPDLVHRDVLLRLAREHLEHAVDDVVGQEGLAVVLADVSVGEDPCLGAQVPRELAAVVVLHDDDLARLPQRPLDGLDVQGHHPLHLVVAQPTSVTSASSGPVRRGGSMRARAPSIFRCLRSIIAWRLCGSVNLSLMRTPRSSCSSVATTCAWPGVPGTARGATPLSVSRYRAYSSPVSSGVPSRPITSPRSRCGLKSSSAGSRLLKPSDSSRSASTIPGHWNRSARLKICGMVWKQSAMLSGAAIRRG